MKNISFIILLSIFAFSCNKHPGEGGTSIIKGKIIVEEYDQTFTNLWATYDGADMDVYIKYGNHETYDDKVKTGPTGIYEFSYLLKGDYTIYVYSKDSTLQSPSGKIVFSKEIKITENKQVVTAPTITVFD